MRSSIELDFIKGIKPLVGATAWPSRKDKVIDALALYNTVKIVEGTSKCPTIADDTLTKAEKNNYEVWNKLLG